jgi:hypothetical protein
MKRGGGENGGDFVIRISTMLETSEDDGGSDMIEF